MRPSRILIWIGQAWLIVGLALILFIVVEGSLSLFFRVKDRHHPALRAVDYRVAADCYPDSAWVSDYYRELQQCPVRWEPYVYWRRSPFSGRHINIDDAGVRATPSSATSSSEPDVEILMLGGSTLWGTGVRDAFTIPSCLSRALRAHGLNCRVVNFGETGYVSTQELILLMRELQSGCRPDLVIFLDGVNDTFSAWQQGEAGIPQNEFRRVEEFNLSNPDQLQHRTSLLLQDRSSRLAMVRLARALLRRMGVAGSNGPGAGPASTAGGDATLTASVVRTYAANIDLAKSLGNRYGFRCVFFWQPTIFEKRHLTEYEETQRELGRPMEHFYRRTYEAVRESQVAADSAEFHDVSALFVDEPGPRYVDWCHLGEAGNQLLAERMVVDVLPLLSEDR